MIQFHDDNITKMSNHDDNYNNSDNSDYNILPYYCCYWLCGRKAELKVYTDFGNMLHLCKMCYEIYDPEHRLKTEEITSRS
jgi:hypothetical protein